jgi:hypothetical protein
LVEGASEKQSILEAMEHLLARKREMRPLFLVPARPMKVDCGVRGEVVSFKAQTEGRGEALVATTQRKPARAPRRNPKQSE